MVVNQLRDLWRVTWQEINGKYGPGHKQEGVWAMPFEASARMVAEDMATCMGSTGMIPGQEDEYPLIREVIVYRMETGKPIEVARAQVTRDRFDGGQWTRENGIPVERGEKYEGWGLETHNGWAEVRSY